MFFQSLSFLRHASAPRRLLHLNLDETSVALTPRPLCGLVVQRRHWGADVEGPRLPVRKGDLRTFVSYVAVISDNDELQQSLPHFVIGNKSVFTLGLMQTVAAECRPGTHVWRTVSPWNSTSLLLAMLDLISLALDGWRWLLEPVLTLDVAPCHLSKEVFLRACEVDIKLNFVPAGATFLLQPLDVRGFFSFKWWLRTEYQILRQLGDGQVSKLDWVRLLMRAREDFWSRRSWRKSFSLTGCLGEALPCLSKKLQAFEIDPQAAGSSPPSKEASQCIWPRNRAMGYAYDLLFKE